MSGIEPGTGLGLGSETLVRAGVVAAMLAAGLGGFALYWMNTAAPHPLDPYRRLGEVAGAAALRRDLQAESPIGSPPEPLVRRLEEFGLGCRGSEVGWTCVRSAPSGMRRVARTVVTIGVAEGAIGTAEVRMTDEALP